MTTIAYRDGILAGDSRETNISEDESPVIVRDNCVKVWKLPDGRVFGASRGSEEIERLRIALIKGHAPPHLDDINGLLIDTKRRIWLYEGKIWQRVPGRYYAVGSGAICALCAMDAGASAIEAVRIGIKRDPYSGGRVRFVRVRGKK